MIVGEGERRALLEHTISDLELDERVVLTGNVQSEGWHRYQDMFRIDRISGEVAEMYRTTKKEGQ